MLSGKFQLGNLKRKKQATNLGTCRLPSPRVRAEAAPHTGAWRPPQALASSRSRMSPTGGPGASPQTQRGSKGQEWCNPYLYPEGRLSLWSLSSLFKHRHRRLHFPVQVRSTLTYTGDAHRCSQS